MRRACYMNLQGDGIKVASKLFQQAAWLFEHLMTLVSQLAPGETSVDFNKETLVQNSNLALAQAQYLFYRKAMEAGMKPMVLAKIAAQCSVYFGKAFEANQSNQSLRQHETGRFANVMGYHARYFAAMSYWNIAEAEFKTADAKAKGMGKAAAMLRVAVNKIEEARPYVTPLGGGYVDNFNKKLADAIALRDKAIDKNKSVYYEQEPGLEALPKPDPQNFVNLVAMTEEINQVPELDAKLRHVVPPQVRQMQEELKNYLQQIVQAQFTRIQQCDENLDTFLKQFNLPQALYSITAGSEVPEDVWGKI